MLRQPAGASVTGLSVPGSSATLIWPVAGAVPLPATGQTTVYQVPLVPPVLLPWPAWSHPEPLRLDLHNLSNSRRPRRSAGWQWVAGRPQAIVCEPTHVLWQLRCGWFTDHGWQWVVVSYPRQAGDHLTMHPQGLRITTTAATPRPVRLDVPAALLDSSLVAHQVPSSLLEPGGSLSSLVASQRAQEAQLVGLVRQAEQAYLASGQARQPAEAEL